MKKKPNQITAHNDGRSRLFRFEGSVVCSGVCEFKCWASQI
jgi:hypothetical protein